MQRWAKTAVISGKAKIGKDVEIGDFAVIHDDVVLGDGSAVGAHCVLGVRGARPGSPALEIGAGAIIRSHCVFYEGSSFGPGLRTGQFVSVLPGAECGAGTQLGSYTELQGKIKIGDHTRFQSRVMVASGSMIGDCVWVFAGTIIANDPSPPSEGLLPVTIEDFAVVSINCSILPGVRIGRGAVIAAGVVLTKDAAPDSLYVGSPARLIGPTSMIMLRDGSGPAYPWTSHFARGYPEELVAQWRRTLKNAG